MAHHAMDFFVISRKKLGRSLLLSLPPFEPLLLSVLLLNGAGASTRASQDPIDLQDFKISCGIDSHVLIRVAMKAEGTSRRTEEGACLRHIWKSKRSELYPGLTI